MRTELRLDHEPIGDGASSIVRALLRLSGTSPAASERIPLNVCLVLDRSGSMAGDKLEHAKQAAALLAKRLWPEDVIGVVAYDSEVVTVAEPGTGAEHTDLPARLRALEAGSATNLSGGWLQGRSLVASRARAAGVNRILLLTDGLANEGITEPAQLVGLCAGALEHGITTTTIGFGEGYDEVLLRRMADAGGGSTYYIEQPDQAPAVLSAELEGLLSLSAQNVAVTLRPARAARLSLIHHNYASQNIEDGVRLRMGDLYAREPRLLLAEFVVNHRAPAREMEVAEFTVHADVLAADGSVEHQDVRLPVRFSPADGARTDPEVRRELLVQAAARARDQARRAQEEGDYGGAAEVLRETVARLESSGIEDASLEEEAADLRTMAERFDAGVVNELDRKYLYQRSFDAFSSKREGARMRRPT
jgi:Ca-activated chloride channel family protein